MGQISTKIYQVSTVYDFSVEGGAIGQKSLGTAIRGGDTIVGIYYSIVIPLVTASVNIDCGYGVSSGTGMVNPAHTVAVLNANANVYFQNLLWNLRKNPVDSTLDYGLYFTNSAIITAGRMLFSFTVMQNPM